MQELYAEGRLYVSAWLSVLASVLTGVLISKIMNLMILETGEGKPVAI